MTSKSSTQIEAPFGRLITAMVTPFKKDGEIDWAGVETLAHHLVASGHDAIAVNGTTGEAPTTKSSEKLEIIRVVKKAVGDKVKVLTGAGDNETAYTVEQAKRSAEAGVDGLLIVTPYYNKPTQEGMYQHFKTIAEKVDLPVILYNVPGRTVADMANETVIRLAKVPGITGIKDATGNLERGTQLIAGLKAAGAHDFAVYSGDDLTALFLMLMGGQGNISVTANVAPKLMHELCVAAMAGDMARTREIQYKLLAVHKSMFIEANPIPVKWALHAMGRMDSGIRLPLTTLSDASQEQVRQALKAAGLLV